MASEAVARPPLRSRSGPAGRRAREAALGYLLLLPAFLILVVFEFFPVFYGGYISMCNWRATGCAQFLGTGNYTRAFEDSEMWKSLLTTATYSLIAVPLQLGLALVLAYLLFQKIRGKSYLPGAVLHAVHHLYRRLGLGVGVSVQPG